MPTDVTFRASLTALGVRLRLRSTAGHLEGPASIISPLVAQPRVGGSAVRWFPFDESNVDRTARLAPDRPPLTYAELDLQASEPAGALAAVGVAAPGSHERMLGEPHMQTLAATLAACLRQES